MTSPSSHLPSQFFVVLVLCYLQMEKNAVSILEYKACDKIIYINMGTL